MYICMFGYMGAWEYGYMRIYNIYICLCVYGHKREWHSVQARRHEDAQKKRDEMLKRLRAAKEKSNADA